MELTAGEDCADACCGATPRRTANELFERGFRRRRAAPFPIEGAAAADGGGLEARFSLRIEGGAIAEARFCASSCATLIAYCELAAELAAGRSLAGAGAITPSLLAAELADVPALKRDRARLAAAALANALSTLQCTLSEDAA